MPCYTSINARKARTRLSVIKAKILEVRSYLCNKCAFSNKYLLSFYCLNRITTYPRLGRISNVTEKEWLLFLRYFPNLSINIETLEDN